MAIEEAREQAKNLNRDLHAYNWLKRRQVIKDQIRKDARQKIKFLPDELRAIFEKELDDHPDPRRMKVLWKAGRRLIRTLQIPPEDWKRRSQTIYNYFEEKHLSPLLRKKNHSSDESVGKFLFFQDRGVILTFEASFRLCKGQDAKILHCASDL